MSSCYTVTRVGNCKYYTPKNLSSKGKAHQLISFYIKNKGYVKETI